MHYIIESDCRSKGQSHFTYSTYNWPRYVYIVTRTTHRKPFMHVCCAFALCDVRVRIYGITRHFLPHPNPCHRPNTFCPISGVNQLAKHPPVVLRVMLICTKKTAANKFVVRCHKRAFAHTDATKHASSNGHMDSGHTKTCHSYTYNNNRGQFD